MLNGHVSGRLFRFLSRGLSGIQLLHQAGFTSGSIVGMNDSLLCRFVQGTDCFRNRFPGIIQLSGEDEFLCLAYNGLALAAYRLVPEPFSPGHTHLLLCCFGNWQVLPPKNNNGVLMSYEHTLYYTLN
jgi:hypothetical protein